MSPPLMLFSCSEQWRGTVITRSAGRIIEVLTVTTLFSSVTSSPLPPPSIRFIPRASGGGSLSCSSSFERARASTTTCFVSAPRTVIPPSIRCARSCTGRDGSSSGTLARSCAAITPALINAIPNNFLITRKTPLAFPMQTNTAVQSVEGKLRTAFAGACSACPIAVIHILAVVPLGYFRRDCARTHIEIAVDFAMERLEAQIRRKRLHKVHINPAIHRFEVAPVARILREMHRNGPVHRMNLARACDASHSDAAVHVAHFKIAAAIHRQISAIHGRSDNPSRSWHLDIDIKPHFVKSAPVVVTIAIPSAAPGRIVVHRNGPGTRLRGQLHFFRIGHIAFRLGPHNLMRDHVNVRALHR